MSEYTPSMEELVNAYVYCMGPDVRRERWAEAERAIAAHDRALREQIARDIEVRIDDDGTDEWFAAIECAARIARGEGDAHRPERCPTCGCELAYPTAVHVVDCGEGSE